MKHYFDTILAGYHPRNHGIFYSINYGHIEDIVAGDGFGQDAYMKENLLLGMISMVNMLKVKLSRERV